MEGNRWRILDSTFLLTLGKMPTTDMMMLRFCTRKTLAFVRTYALILVCIFLNFKMEEPRGGTEYFVDYPAASELLASI